LADKDLLVRLDAFVKLASFELDKGIRKTASLLMQIPQNSDDEWLRLPLRAMGAGDLNLVGYEKGPNLLPNPSFESVANGLPKEWTVRTYSGKGKPIHQIEKRKKFVKSGKSSLMIGSDGFNDTSLYTSVNLKAGVRYSFSAWIKAENVSGAMGALLNVHELQKAAMTKGIRNTSNWQKVETEFLNPSNRRVTLNCLFGGWGQSKGRAWYDDVSFNELNPIYQKTKEQKIIGRIGDGKEIFEKHLSAGCARCHKVGGQGGDVGPPLDGIASRKTKDYIYESLIKPGQVLAKGYEKFGASPMPPMDILLDKQELADVMSYLLTLK
jgi:mono/diheme cytochrome c family protein